MKAAPEDLAYGFQSVAVDTKSDKEFLEGIINNHPLSNFDMKHYIDFRPYKRHFKGFVSTSRDTFTYITDSLPLSKLDFYIIFNPNIKDTSSIGHWTMVLHLSDGLAYYDPCGKMPRVPVLSWMKKYKDVMYDSVVWSKFDQQNDDSALCGYFVLYTLDKLFEGRVRDLQSFNDLVDNMQWDDFVNNHAKLYKHFRRGLQRGLRPL